MRLVFLLESIVYDDMIWFPCVECNEYMYFLHLFVQLWRTLSWWNYLDTQSLFEQDTRVEIKKIIFLNEISKLTSLWLFELISIEFCAIEFVR